MKTENMMAVFADNVKDNAGQLAELLEAYDLAKIGYDAQEAHGRDIYNRVLAENIFLCGVEDPQGEFRIGDRITDDNFSFLLSDDDYTRFSQLASPLFVAEGITDENGYYKTDWLTIKGDARRALVDFMITEIIPEEIRQNFEICRLNITQAAKLIDIARQITAAA